MPLEPLDREVFSDGPLSVSRNRYGEDGVVVSLAGELDQSNVASARRIVGAPDGMLIVDLSSLEFIDSSGIALLVSLAEGAADGGRLRVVPSEAAAVARVLKLTGVDATLPIARDETLSA